MPSVPRPLIERRLSRFLREPVSVRSAASVIVVATAVIVVVSGAAIRVLDADEYGSIWEGIWWAMQTVTTVGYGDVTPENVAGRFVAGAVMLAGVALVAIVTAAVTSSFVARAQAQRGAEDATEDARRPASRCPASGHHRAAGPGRADARRAQRAIA